jgi:hypothetical protein
LYSVRTEILYAVLTEVFLVLLLNVSSVEGWDITRKLVAMASFDNPAPFMICYVTGYVLISGFETISLNSRRIILRRVVSEIGTARCKSEHHG